MVYSEYFNFLFVSSLLIISSTFLCGYAFRNVSREHMNSFIGQLKFGILGGALSIGLMYYSTAIRNTTTILDFRVLALLTTFYVGGLFAATVNGIITISFRILYFGLSPSSILNIEQVLFILFFFLILHFIQKYKTLNKYLLWFLSAAWCFGINIVINMLSMKNLVTERGTIITRYSVFLMIAFVFQFFMIEYVISSNRIYIRYKNNAKFDHLTSLINPRYFDTMFRQFVAKVEEENSTLSFFMIDIDFFKHINDTYGHANGDIILKELGAIFQSFFKEKESVARIGGEEFCVLIKDDLNKAELMANHLREKIEKNKFILNNKDTISVTVSIGIANYPESTNDFARLKEFADLALYDAKNLGRNQVCIYKKEVHGLNM